jgi:hypothetical protein
MPEEPFRWEPHCSPAATALGEQTSSANEARRAGERLTPPRRPGHLPADGRNRRLVEQCLSVGESRRQIRAGNHLILPLPIDHELIRGNLSMACAFLGGRSNSTCWAGRRCSSEASVWSAGPTTTTRRRAPASVNPGGCSPRWATGTAPATPCRPWRKSTSGGATWLKPGGNRIEACESAGGRTTGSARPSYTALSGELAVAQDDSNGSRQPPARSPVPWEELDLPLGRARTLRVLADLEARPAARSPRGRHTWSRRRHSASCPSRRRRATPRSTQAFSDPT